MAKRVSKSTAGTEKIRTSSTRSAKKKATTKKAVAKQSKTKKVASKTTGKKAAARKKVSKQAGAARSKTAASKKKAPEKSRGTGPKGFVPKVGQKVIWHALPGDVEGEVTRILTQDTVCGGKKIRASASDPRIELKSHHSGKICYHKPQNVRPA